MEKDKVEKSTTGKTSLDENNVMQQRIKDPFKSMIRVALNQQHKALMQRKSELETWGESAQARFKKSFGFADEKARIWILEGIKKELMLNESISINNFIKINENVYANVNSTDLEHNINIGKKFYKAALIGKDSQVVTLCHEMSHFDDILATKDLGGNSPRKYAINLAAKGDERTMQNSYNFEMYFE
ncbi:M35 family metallo-endopeptidase [Lelliottia amnigena]|uniref:M35 family metallo-endopeptidase n=1 Tax=Lelliottia amnigena TaxID=61646 RepID=UPI004055F5A4